MADQWILPAAMKAGDPIAKVPFHFYNTVDEVLSRLQVYGGTIDRAADNTWTIYPQQFGGGTASGYLKPLDLYGVDLSGDTYKIRGAGGLSSSLGNANKAFGIASVWTAIAAGTQALDTATAIAASTWIYAKIVTDSGGDTVTLEKTTSTSNTFFDAGDNAAGTEATMNIPLWFIPWDGAATQMDIPNIEDWRSAPLIPRMGN